MKYLILIAAAFSIFNSSLAQTTATDFTANDCNNVSHNLFTELNDGKIIVIAWVMPCGGCAPAAKAAYDAVQSYATSNPNTVFFYLVDDYANTTCSTLSTWGNNNSMPNAVKFSNSAISMSDYGVDGMPKIVVLGGSNHSIAYNANSGVTTSDVQSAINGLLSVATVEEIEASTGLKMTVAPNPVKNEFQFEFSLDIPTNVKIEVFTLSGEVVSLMNLSNQTIGKHSITIGNEIEFENGMYVLKLTTDSKTESINFLVQK